MVGGAGETAAHDSLVDRRSRSGNLDILRGFAALMVVVIHAHGLNFRVVEYGSPERVWTLRWLGDALWFFGASGVFLFFALSGYLISKPFVRSLVAGEPLPSTVGYAIRRAARIYPLYWVVLTAAILVNGGFGVPGEGGYFPVHYALLHNLARDRQSAILWVAWSLSIELLFYVLVPLAAALIAYLAYGKPVRASKLATIVGITWLASIAFGYATFARGVSDVQQYVHFLFPAFVGMFCPGILIAVGEQSLGSSRWRWWLRELPMRRGALLVAAAALVGAVWIQTGLRFAGSPEPDSTYRMIFDLANPLFALGYGLIVARAVRARPWGGRLRPGLVELGLISYGVYLIHAIVVLTFLRTDWGRDLIPLPHGGVVAFFVHTGLVLAITLPLAWISWHGFERPILVRAVAVANRWQGRRQPPPEHGLEARPAAPSGDDVMQSRVST